MNEQIFTTLGGINTEIYGYLIGFPNECPYCHKHIIPEFKYDYFEREQYRIFATLVCPNADCDKPFIAEYSRGSQSDYNYKSLVKYSVVSKKFSDEIISTSPKFQ